MAAPNATVALVPEAAPLPDVAAAPAPAPAVGAADALGAPAVPTLRRAPAVAPAIPSTVLPPGRSPATGLFTPGVLPLPGPAHAARPAYAAESAVLARIDDLAPADRVPAAAPATAGAVGTAGVAAWTGVPAGGGRPGPGHAVVALGPAAPDGRSADPAVHPAGNPAVDPAEETVAVWSVDLDGARTGGCVLPVAAVHTDPAAARLVLALVGGRAVVTATPKPVRRLLTRAAHTAGVERPRIDWPVLDLGATIREVARTRTRYVAAIDQHRARRGRSADSEPSFSWAVDEVVTSAGGGALVDVTGVYAPRHTVPAAGQAVRLTRLLVRTIAAWRETELAKVQRPHLRRLFGAPQVLPQRWHTTVQDAHARPLGG